MNKHDNLHILFDSLNGCLPYEYYEKFVNNETAIVITKEKSDYTMYVSSDENNGDDFIVEIACNDPANGHHKEYETYHWPTEDDQIPLSDIISDIENRL